MSLSSCAVGDQLTGEHAEGLHVLLPMLKHRHHPVKIHYLPVFSLEGEVFVDGRQAIGKQRQLKLRHGPVSLRPFRSATAADLKLGEAIFHVASKTRGEISSSEIRLGALVRWKRLPPVNIR